MKKMIFTIFIILFCPIYIFAYSKYVIPGGESIGIKINTDGLIVVGYYKVDNKFINSNIKIGDRIIKINDEYITSINDLTTKIDKNIQNNDEINLLIIRNNKEVNEPLTLESNGFIYKTGIFVKDSVVGLGTLTYIDPISKIYGALGHDIVLNETNNRVEIKDGNILMSSIKSISKSRNGSVGSKNANLYYDKKIGSILINNQNGIFGKYTANLPKKDTIEIASFNDIEIGEAKILTVTKNNEIKEYKIKIIDKYSNKKHTNKAFSFEVIDEDLLGNTGGIVQGMSGSPIIQNDKIIGCVTNVVVDNVKLGYGISIITMLEDGDKLRN